MQRGHSLDVGFVDYEFFIGDRRLAIIAPIVSGIDHDTLGHRRRAVPQLSTKGRAMRAAAIPEHRIVPLERAIDRARIRIEQQLCGIETMPRARIVSSAEAVAVTLSGTTPRNIRMPYMFGALDQRYPRDFVVAIFSAKQTKDCSGSVLGEQREVRSLAVEVCPERILLAGQNFRFAFEFDRRHLLCGRRRIACGTETNGKPFNRSQQSFLSLFLICNSSLRGEAGYYRNRQSCQDVARGHPRCARSMSISIFPAPITTSPPSSFPKSSRPTT